MSPSGKLLATACYDKAVRIWEIPSDRSVGLVLDLDSEPLALSFSPDGERVVYRCNTQLRRTWDLRAGRLIESDSDASVRPIPAHVARMRHAGPALAPSFDDPGRVAMARGGRVEVFGGIDSIKVIIDNIKYRIDFKKIFDLNGTVSLYRCACDLGFDGGVAAAGATYTEDIGGRGQWRDGGVVRAFDVATGRPIGMPMRPPRGILCIAVSTDGKLALTGGEDNMARLWDVSTGAARGAPWDHQNRIDSVALSPDGKTAATGCDDGVARTWAVATGQPAGPPLSHLARVRVIAFSPDSKLVLTGCEDGAVRLWDVSTSRPIGPALHHRGRVLCVAMSPDGKRVASGGSDKTIRMWEIVPPETAQVGDITRSLQLETGMRLESTGLTKLLDPADWDRLARRPDSRAQ
jgi:WD40 repeat protein